MIVLIRHAKADHNKDNIFAGGRIDTNIVDEGKEEAKKQSIEMSKKYCFDVIICSNLKRSYQTAKIHQKQQKEKYGKTIPIIKTIFLNEVDLGNISGMTIMEAKNKYPIDYNNSQSKNIEDWFFNDGEKPDLLYKRYLKLIKLIKKYSKKNILLVGHAMFNKFILENWIKLEEVNFDHNHFIELPVFKKNEK